MKMILAPSMLSADFKNLGKDITQAVEAGAEYLHIDVMDGQFVPNISFGMPVIKSIRSLSDVFFDVHLMIEEPIRYLDDFVKCGADLITVHVEACKDPAKTLEEIRKRNVKAGITICPETDVAVLEPLYDKVDMVLIMTVRPGFGGQSYMPEMEEKIRTVRKILDEKYPDVNLEVDGGVNESTIRRVMEAGANVVVAGSAVFGGDIEGNCKKLLSIMKEYES